ncbi:hypothetical protein SAMN05216323_106626 [Williamwhitmania taraxaci]|uniref:HTH domain-containing protein n=1 Tax=Williamwhitmania taraxaci TaxID=1640674 RepID=A0A1G6QWE8_9BACT|nr:hypothetical protein SAMN05216323_106626 [Williamwhitmania taraxaci]
MIKSHIQRYVLLLKCIRQCTYPSIREIAEYVWNDTSTSDFALEISYKRIITNDINDLRVYLGINITYDRCKRGYYIPDDDSVDNGFELVLDSTHSFSDI